MYTVGWGRLRILDKESGRSCHFVRGYADQTRSLNFHSRAHDDHDSTDARSKPDSGVCCWFRRSGCPAAPEARRPYQVDIGMGTSSRLLLLEWQTPWKSN